MHAFRAEKFDPNNACLNSADYAAFARKFFEEEREVVKRRCLKL